MKFKTLSAMCLAATSVFAASSAMAWESEDGAHSTSANVGLFSDYLFRGISFTDDKPAIQGGFDYAHSSGLYAGTWASNLSIDDETNIEIDIYAGFANEFGESGIGYDVGAVRYIYPGTENAMAAFLTAILVRQFSIQMTGATLGKMNFITSLALIMTFRTV